jgi:hypothetical protein
MEWKKIMHLQDVSEMLHFLFFHEQQRCQEEKEDRSVKK